MYARVRAVKERNTGKISLPRRCEIVCREKFGGRQRKQTTSVRHLVSLQLRLERSERSWGRRVCFLFGEEEESANER